MSLLVVITSYRAPDLTIDCLYSLEKEILKIPGAKVGICDNGNEDNTANQLNKVIKDEGWEDWAYVKTVMPNRGFSGGNNVILRDALLGGDCPEYFLLLNADTIVQPNALISLIQLAEQYKKAGIVCSQLEDLEGIPQTSCFRYKSPISEMLDAARTGPLSRLFSKWDVPMPISDKVIEMDWGCFASVLIKTEVMKDIGVLDEGYFLYFDDIDYCRAAKNAGWKTIFCPDSHVIHIEGQSNPVVELKSLKKRPPRYLYISRSWYFTKFYGKSGLLLANLLWIMGRTISFLRETIGNKEVHLCENEWQDNWIGFFKSVKPRTSISAQK